MRAAGHTYEHIRQLVRRGDLTPLRRGAYLAGPEPEDARVRHRLLIRATLSELSPTAVLSHASAAVWHGLPTWRIPLRRVHVTRIRSSGGRRSARVHVHVASLPAAEVVLVDGVPVTSVARTVVDVARSRPFEEAVVVADGALAAGLTDREELAAVLHGLHRRRGLPSARLAVEFADARAESVGESRSRVAIMRAGLPVPTLQWEVRDRHGRQIGRPDFGWEEQLVAGEFDGRIKYGRLVRPGESAGDVVYREKLREDRLRTVLRAVVRWTWNDLDEFAPTAARLRTLLHP